MISLRHSVLKRLQLWLIAVNTEYGFCLLLHTIRAVRIFIVWFTICVFLFFQTMVYIWTLFVTHHKCKKKNTSEISIKTTLRHCKFQLNVSIKLSKLNWIFNAEMLFFTLKFIRFAFKAENNRKQIKFKSIENRILNLWLKLIWRWNLQIVS